MIVKLINKVVGDTSSKTLKRIKPLVTKINSFEEEYQKTLNQDEDFPRKTEEFKQRIKDGENLDDLLPEAFALVKCACSRIIGKQWKVRGQNKSWDMIPYDVQLIGGIVLHQGNIAEMKTGEGKTLVCTMPAYLNALTDKGVFVVTVNEYLAQRDSEWVGGLFRFLGLSSGVILNSQKHDEKKEAYANDIIYGTNNEFGFDYLRDNMSTTLDKCVQRNLNYAIIDEVDSILIDEARTPLIISAPASQSTSAYQQYSGIIQSLEVEKHYKLDEKGKSASLTEEGIAHLEKTLNVENIYSEKGFATVHHIEQALKAHAAYKKDSDYVVKDGQVIIVDEFTGRLMPGRRYGDGLHQAIEAKEGVEVRRESKTLATITFQNYFRLFNKLSGMTGTAATEAEEFYKIYGLDTIIIPTNRPMTRKDLNDSIYKTHQGKLSAIAKKVKELNKKGQPALVGTISIEKSELLSRLLTMQGVKHKVLNAKHHEQEAEIITRAGETGTVTIATNMAGRGTDIKLGEGVKEAGGLAILGTERHESRRIDNQLRGRSGRQGDPGFSQFFVSMEDDLMRMFGAERVKRTMDILKVPEDMPIENRMISKSIESAQKKVEGHNFDIRKHLVEYDDVMNKHRDIIYKKRRKILENEDIKNEILSLIENETHALVQKNSTQDKKNPFNFEEIIKNIELLHTESRNQIKISDLEKHTNQESLSKEIYDFLIKMYENIENQVPDTLLFRHLEKNVYLRIVDTLWMEHIDNMSALRDSVAFKGYAQKDPLIEYKSQAYETFQTLLGSIEKNTINTLFKIKVSIEEKEIPVKKDTPENLLTNKDQIKDISTGDRELVVNRSTFTEPKQAEVNKVGRNDPCPCGSKKKYKKCCGK